MTDNPEPVPSTGQQIVVSRIEDCKDLLLIEPLFLDESVDWDELLFRGASRAIRDLEAAMAGPESAYSNLVDFDPDNDSKLAYTDGICRLFQSLISIVLERDLTEQEREELIEFVVEDFSYEDPVSRIYPIISKLRQRALQYFMIEVIEYYQGINSNLSLPFGLGDLSWQPTIVFNPFDRNLMLSLPIPIVEQQNSRGILLLGDTDLENYKKDYGIVRLRLDPTLTST